MTEWGGESDRGRLWMFDVISGFYPVNWSSWNCSRVVSRARTRNTPAGLPTGGRLVPRLATRGIFKMIRAPSSLDANEALVFITFTTFPPHRQSHFCCSGWHHHHNYSKRLANKELPAMMCRNNEQLNVYILNQCIDLDWNFKDHPPISIHWNNDALLSWSPTAL